MELFKNAIRCIECAVTDGATPSAAFAIGIGNKLYVKETIGYTSVTPEQSKINENTLYDMASATKIMATAMVALRMIADGRLALHDPLTRFFGDSVSEDKRTITIAQLMSHHAGYHAHVMLDQEIARPDEALPFLLTMPLAYTPGENMIYSCLGYIVLGKILETVGGQPLDILAKHEVFDPLGMTHTCFCPPRNNNIAYTERDPQTGGWLAGTVHDENARFLGGVAGNAGLFSNLSDCIRFATMLANHGTLDSVKFLPHSVFDTAIKDHGHRRGLGFHLAGGQNSYAGAAFPDTGFGHTGFTGPHFLVDAKSGFYTVLLQNRVHPMRTNTAAIEVRRTFNTLAAEDVQKLL